MYIHNEQVKEIIEKVRGRLSEKGRERGMDIKIRDEDYKIDEEWLYLSVYPTSTGIRPYQYAEILEEIEKELRDQSIENVLLVPVISEK